MTTERQVLVTGAGGPAGIAVINELKRRGVGTVACDINPYGAGLRLADSWALVPRFDEANYFDELFALASRTGANGLISTMTEELSVLTNASSQEKLAAAGLAHWFPPKAAVDICMDKREFARVTEAANQPVPLSGWGDVDEALAKVPGPWIVKPCFGRGSRDVFALDSAAEVRAVWSRVADPILQTRLAGTEFTLDALVGRDGTLLGGVPRFRLETKAGISTVGRTFESPGLMDLTESLLASIGHSGPANVQGFIDLETGDFGFMEVNPRFSGALPLSLGSGCDLVGQYVNGMYGDPIDAESLSYVPGTVMIRHFQETFFEEEVEPTVPLRPVR